MEVDDKTLWCGNLAEQVNEELLYELFLQAGPLEKVTIAKDRDGRQKNFAFITFCHEVSVPYAIKLFRGTALFHRTLALQSRGRMVPLPPPIKCFRSESTLDLLTQTNINEQVPNKNNVTKEILDSMQMIRQPYDLRDKLVVASLQGNWTHRHHPYKPQEQKSHRRNDYRTRDSHGGNYKSPSHIKHMNGWRDNRSSRRSNHHRRE